MKADLSTIKADIPARYKHAPLLHNVLQEQGRSGGEAGQQIKTTQLNVIYSISLNQSLAKRRERVKELRNTVEMRCHLQK